MNAPYQPRYAEGGLDRDADAVPSLLEDALGEQLGTHGCVRNIAGEEDDLRNARNHDYRNAGAFGFGAEDEAALSGPPLSNYGFASPAQKQALQAASAMQRASHLAQGMGGTDGFDFSGRVPTTFKTPKAAGIAGAGKTVTCAKCGRVRAVGQVSNAEAALIEGRPLLTGAGGAVIGGLLLGPLGALVGAGVGYFLGR